jgi:polysaccharide biosynthesis/export protein
MIRESSMGNLETSNSPHAMRLGKGIMKTWGNLAFKFCVLTCAVFSANLWGQVAASNQPGTGSDNVATSGSSAQTETPARPPHVDDTYIIGDEDVLSISVWKELDLTKVIPVRSDGKISLPLVGDVQAAGRTPAQLAEDLTAALRGFITDPQVTVIVQEIKSRNFNILGQVAKPGSYPLITDTTVVDAIALAGGFRDFAKKKGIYIVRKDANGTEIRIPFNYEDFIKAQKGKKGKHPTPDIQIKPHDTIVVP